MAHPVESIISSGCTAATTIPDECLAQRSARIETATVDVPGDGYP